MNIDERQNWLRRLIQRPLRCIFGFHGFSWLNWSVPVHDAHGQVTFHCPYCEKVVRHIPFDDIPEEKRMFMNATIQTLKEFED